MAGLGSQLTRLGRQSIIYGAGGLIQRVLAVLLLPIYTRYLTPSDYGTVETLIALTTVLVIVLRLGISTAFIRFYFDSKDPVRRRLVLRTSFWFTMTMATVGLVLGLALSPEIASGLFGSSGEALVVAAAFVGLWAQMNWEQMLALFRVEERAVAFVSATLVNIGVTIAATLTLVVALDKGALGVIVGNFTGTLVVYVLLLGYRREQLGLQVDRHLLRAMNRYGLPLVPSALMLWVTNFSDRFLLLKLADSAEVGLYSVGVRVASAMALLLTAFRMSWPPFAYSIEDDREAKATYSFVLTYVMTFMTWVATGLALLSPWLVDLIAAPEFSRSSDVVGPLAFSVVLFSGYVVVAIGLGRTKRTQFNWVVTGAAAIVNV
ncbi:MAG TPA: oligosaccharide flippase family protein, partial [Gaiellaceae bacterium]|nr:oligosaccharide flippase family protein [Gaiellaceae bacterium]